MSEFVDRESEMTEDEIYDVLDQGYLEFVDFEADEIYFYDPLHWKHPSSGQPYDYMFDDLYLQSLTPQAKELAESEGGEPDIVP